MTVDGIFKFYQNGKLIAECPNNITTNGRILAIKTLMGAIPSFGTSIGIGVGESANTFSYSPTSIVISGTAPSQTVVVTITGHALRVGNRVSISGITAGPTALNGTSQTITAIATNTITFISSTSLTNGTYTSGLGTIGTLATNYGLDFKVASSKVLSSHLSKDPTYDAIVFKTTIEDPLSYRIKEIGLFSEALLNAGTTYQTETLLAFEPSENWQTTAGVSLPTTGTVTRLVSYSENSNFRIGDKALQVIGSATQASRTAVVTDTYTDLNKYSSEDFIKLAFYSAGSLNVTVKFESGNNSNNSKTYTFAGVAGYNVVSVKISSGSSGTGTIDWSNITKITIENTSSTNNIVVDGLRFERRYIPDANAGIVSRAVLPTAIEKLANTPLDIEYYLRLGFNG